MLTLPEVSACETKLRGTGTVVLGGLGKHKLWNAHRTTHLHEKKYFKNSNLKSAPFFTAGNPETAGIATAAPSHADVGSSTQPQMWQLLTCPSTWGWRLPAKRGSQLA